jgi:LytS/YehU family sensor histidine kinase
MTMWVPLFIFFSYPLVYLAIPYLLLKEKVIQFFVVVLAWGVAGLYFDPAYRSFLYIPLQEAMGLNNILPRGPISFCYLCMTTSAVGPMMIKFFKLITLKQQEVMRTEEEKTIAELQLLKSQVHPHFLFNTLNNIYAFSILHSPKTPDLILKLSSLLKYMLYECRSEEVTLEKEIQIIRNYMDLEKERYGNKIQMDIKVEGDLKGIMISPLLLMPFMENAFKHGLSEQIANPKLQLNISVKNGLLTCVISNSKNEYVHFSEKGIGINNVKKRLALVYPESHELKIEEKAELFTVQLKIAFTNTRIQYRPVAMPMQYLEKNLTTLSHIQL